MVTLQLIPHRGNPLQRYYPHFGALNLSPVVIQGKLKLALEDSGEPLLPCSSIKLYVKCYEQVGTDLVGGGGRITRVLYSTPEYSLWNRSEAKVGTEWEEVGNLLVGFRVILPVEVPRISTTTFRGYKTWWQIEAGESACFLSSMPDS